MSEEKPLEKAEEENAQTVGQEKLAAAGEKAMTMHDPMIILTSAAAFIAAGALAYFFKGHSAWLTVQAALMAAILCYTAIVDLRTHLISVLIPIALLAPAAINLIISPTAQELLNMGLGVLITAGLYMLVTLISMVRHRKDKSKRHISWGDIEVLAASGLILGLGKGYIALIASLVLATIVDGILIAAKKADKNKPFAFTPYIAVGSMVAYFL
jgi:prepilin signal peptidase PulO-like enzyme (type II secretory pathway)